jgi:flavin-binding protein dodecin
MRRHLGWSGLMLSGLTAVFLMPLGGCGGGGTSASAGTAGPSHPPGTTGDPLAVPLEFAVHNELNVPRTETVRVSVPFPQGGYAAVDRVAVSGHPTAWTVLQRWSDGSVKIAQAQFTDDLQPNEVKHYSVVRDVLPLTGAFVRNDWVAQQSGNLLVGAQVSDTFDVQYRTYAGGATEVLESTPLVQVARFRNFHIPVSVPGIGRDYLTSTFYVTEFRDVPVVVVDWVLGNDYLGVDAVPAGNTDPSLNPLGMIDVKDARFLVGGATEVLPYRATEEAISAAETTTDGLTAFPVMQNTYLEDGQTRRYRFFLRFEDPAASQADKDHWRYTATAMQQRQLQPLASIATWQQTAAAGLLGGPIDPPADAEQRADADFGSWAAANQFGTWGSHGDIMHTATTGTPRNGPCSEELGHAIQADHPGQLLKLEQMAWAQAMRPYHLYGLQVGAEQDILLWDGVPVYPGSRDLSHESLGRRALWANDPYPAYRSLTETGSARAHGWEHFDHEHWSTDLLFDYWTVTGDHWAHEELRQLGESLKALMRLRTYSTSYLQAARAEGWTMQGFVQVYLATGDAAIRDYALRRVHEIVDVQRHKSHPSRAMTFQDNYTGTFFPLNHRFFMPWQHGAVLYGYLGAYRYFNDPLLFRICEDVTTTVDYSWMRNYVDPQLGLVRDGLRYYVPVEYNGRAIAANYWDGTAGIGVRWGDSPLGGAHSFLLGGLLLLADWSADYGVQQRATYFGSHIRGAISNADRWDKWRMAIPSDRAQ